MQAIVEFRRDVYGPILAEYNVYGAGHDHINDKCHLWANMREYGYWSVVYGLNNPKYNKLMTNKGGWPYIDGAANG